LIQIVVHHIAENGALSLLNGTTNAPEQGQLTHLGLPTSSIAAVARLSIGVHRHMAELAREARSASGQLSVLHDGTAQANASADKQHFPVALSRAEQILAQGGQIRFVIDKYRRSRKSLGENITEGNVLPLKVGREQQRAGFFVD
jgi:hypothetical protein